MSKTLKHGGHIIAMRIEGLQLEFGGKHGLMKLQLSLFCDKSQSKIIVNNFFVL